MTDENAQGVTSHNYNSDNIYCMTDENAQGVTVTIMMTVKIFTV